MTNNEILQADLLDILFENRNKTYGAYALRKTYNKRLSIALVSAFMIVVTVIISAFLRKNDKGQSATLQNYSDTLTIRTFTIPPEELPPPPKSVVTEPPASIDFQTIVVKPDDEVIEPIAEQERLITDIISDHTIVSQFHEDRIMPPITTNAFQEPVEEKEPGKKILIREKPASFPGGESAWLNFLQRYLHTPGDLEEGQRIEVRVQFWIEADGSLSRFEIVKSGGTSFDKEVLRVMTKMPKWIPAIQNDHNVPVSFTQPVIFLSVEE